MPISSNEKQENAVDHDSLPDPEQNVSEVDGDEESGDNLSEVARRINLLGKLVIPPPLP